MSQSGHYETIRTLGMCNSCDFLHGFIIMCGCIECLNCILRILKGYSLVPTSHLYVPITFPTLNCVEELAHFSWDDHPSMLARRR